MDLKYANGNTMKINCTNKYDEYFTKREVSAHLFEKVKQVVSAYENVDNFTWLEPSVGEGCFFDLLPHNKIGIDIKQTRPDIVCQDYLNFELPNKPMIVIGNPPFGHRGVLALEFINHSSSANYVAFILPMFFQSLGKGSVRYRVKNLNLIYEEVLPKNSFYTADNKDKDVKCCFQIWSKDHKLDNNEYSWYRTREKIKEPYNNILKLVTVSLAKKRECGKEWIFDKKANHYLSSTFYKENKVSQSFDEVNYKSGIAIIYITKQKSLIRKLDKIIHTADWNKYSSLATNGCRHIGKSHIYKLLSDAGV